MAVDSWLTCANTEQNSEDALRAMSSRVDKPKTASAKKPCQPFQLYLRHVRVITMKALNYQQAKRFLNA